MNEQNDQAYARDHLANERTFLAWVRTGIAIMAFGFVVVKSSLFVNNDEIEGATETVIPGEVYSAIVGIILVVAGAALSTVSFLRYKRAEKMLRDGNYRQSSLFLSVMAMGVLIISVLLIVYLLRTL